MFDAVMTTCVLDPKLKASQIGKCARELLHADYTAEDVTKFGDWYAEFDWRGKKGQAPTLPLLIELIAQSKQEKRQNGNDNYGISAWGGSGGSRNSKQPTEAELEAARIEFLRLSAEQGITPGS